MRDRRATAFAAPGAAVEPRHLGGGAGLVDEHQALGIECLLELAPETSAMRNVRTILLGGVRGFF